MFASIFGLRCPRCRHGKLFSVANPFNFKRLNDMPEHCPSCGQPFELEPGFYFGATYVSYAFNVAWLVPLFITVRFVFGLSFRTFVIIMFALLPVLIPVIVRVSRSVWLHFFVKFDRAIAKSVREETAS